jgi:glycosyltransferase involved in cell wall biosynthesis
MTQQPILYRGKTVTTIHDLTTARFTNPIKNLVVFKFKQQIYKFVIKRVARKSNEIIVPSKFVKDDVVQFTQVSPNKITVTHEAGDKITVPAQTVKVLDDKRFIMYVGRAQPHKNLNTLVDAFAGLKSEHPDLQLVLVGKIDANYILLKKYVEKKAIKNVVFAGYVSDGELRWLYENTAAYVFPSLSEGFGLPALEALAHGTPVISSRATCLPEIYGDAALYFDPKDPEDIAQKIKIVLEDPKIAQRLHLMGPGQAAKYSWQRTAQQTLEVYKNALG